MKSDVEKKQKDQTTESKRDKQHKPLHNLYWVFGAQFCFCFSIVVTFPYFSPFVQQYGVTNQAWIGFYTPFHTVCLLTLCRKSSSVFREAQPPSSTCYFVPWFWLALSQYSDAPNTRSNNANHRASCFGLGDGLLLPRLHQALANQIDRQQSGKIFSRFDAMSMGWCCSA
ncbi:hypothetical protein OK016_24860 [Vibrio chagasii]|nr:hypothetical protein [Vibrio chagasii]